MKHKLIHESNKQSIEMIFVSIMEEERLECAFNDEQFNSTTIPIST